MPGLLSAITSMTSHRLTKDFWYKCEYFRPCVVNIDCLQVHQMLTIVLRASWFYILDSKPG